MAQIITYIQMLRSDEDGAAMTEYLVLLGILAAGVAGAITLFGGGLTGAIDSWTTFIGTNASAPA